MRKFISILMICTILFAFCSCNENQSETTEPLTEGDSQVVADNSEISDGNASDSDVHSATDAVQQPSEEIATLNNDVLSEVTIPAVEDYTFLAEDTNNKTNFIFEGEKKSTQTCNKIIMTTPEGATQLSISFASDGSGLTVYTLEPNGDKYTTLARFDKQGRLVGVFNGSGAYSDYTYGDDNTCVLQVYDAEGVLLDHRKYYYDDNNVTQRVEIWDGQDIVETYNYVSDDSGKIVSLRVENSTGYILYEYQYAENGMVASRRIEQNDVFYALQTYTYDNNSKRLTYTIRNDEKAPHYLDKTVQYNNVYDDDGTYLGTAEVDSETGEVYIAVAYDYVETDYPHYAEFIQDHFVEY